MVSSEDGERRRRIRRTTVLLAVIALAFYIGFILMSVMRGMR